MIIILQHILLGIVTFSAIVQGIHTYQDSFDNSGISRTFPTPSATQNMTDFERGANATHEGVGVWGGYFEDKKRYEKINEDMKVESISKISIVEDAGYDFYEGISY